MNKSTRVEKAITLVTGLANHLVLTFWLQVLIYKKLK